MESAHCRTCCAGCPVYRSSTTVIFDTASFMAFNSSGMNSISAAFDCSACRCVWWGGVRLKAALPKAMRRGRHRSSKNFFDPDSYLYGFVMNVCKKFHLIFMPGIRGVVSTSSSDLTISFVPVLYLIKCGVCKCAL